MSQPLAILPRFDRFLLRTVQTVVPAADREDWLRTWHSELWHLHHSRRTRTKPTATLALGLTRDALWLRTEASKRALEGTATLCIASLASACLLSAVVALLLTGSHQEFVQQLTAPYHRFLLEAVLVVFVTFATTSRRHVHHAHGTLPVLRRKIFFLLKSALVLLLAFLVSIDLCQPLHADFPLALDISQTFLAAIFSITGLRWAFHDQEDRCKHCLLALQSPARIGRPSHNLLEWNGTEQVCRHGHGRLNLPEMETSWCRSGQWLEPHPDHRPA
jgi:hypothetical protein